MQRPATADPKSRSVKYVLITAARNEELHIGRTIESVTSQTVLPERWVIVDDGSTDRTAEIAQQSASRHPWIVVVRRAPRPNRSFRGKADAVNAGMECLAGVDADVVANLDADVSFAPDYVEFILEKFAADPGLGIAGTPFLENEYDSARDSFEGENFVAGPFQLFRLKCFKEIGGYVPNHKGGVDWIAVMTARMMGWKVQAFPQKRFLHHRPMGTAERNQLSALFSYGEKDYYLGGSFLWQIFRVAYRITKRPYLVGGAALLLGYAWAALRQVKRPVSPELMRFHRKEQMRKLRLIFRSLLGLKKFESFRLGGRPSESTK